MSPSPPYGGISLIYSIRFYADLALLSSAMGVFITSVSFQSPTPPAFTPDFRTPKLEKYLQIRMGTSLKSLA